MNGKLKLLTGCVDRKVIRSHIQNLTLNLAQGRPYLAGQITVQ
jgi:hypothetical protein